MINDCHNFLDNEILKKTFLVSLEFTLQIQ